MSPEQARGKSVDKRADIWAFGAVLYEMLSGRKAFEGETVSDTLAAILMSRSGLVRVARRRRPPRSGAFCGAASIATPRTRFRDIADARVEMDEVVDSAPSAATPVMARPRANRTAWVVAALIAAAGALGWWRALSAPKPAAAPRTAFAVAIPAGDLIAYDDTPILALSRDGRRLVYAAERAGARSLFLRTLGEIEPRAIEGTTGGRSPFFSPDGQWIGFFAEGGKLKKAPVSGGPPQLICEGINAQRGAVWADDDTIILTADYAAGLSRVSARGGKLEPLTKVDASKGERTHRWPDLLPGGEKVIFTIGSEKSPGNYDDAKVALLDRKSGRVRVLLEGGSMGRYCPPGYLLYVRSRSLLAVPFDVRRQEIVGESFPVPEKIAGDPSSGIGYFAAGVDGSFAFVPGTSTSVESKLVLTDRKGAVTELPLPPRQYRFPRFSPDGSRIAFSIGSGRGADDEVWTYQLSGGGLTRLTFSGGNFSPIWSGDGTRLAFVSARATNEGIYARSADGSGAEEWIYGDFTARLPSDWSRDGKTLLFTHPSNQVWMAALKGAWSSSSDSDKDSHMIEPSAYGGVFSPDDRWIAYAASLVGSRGRDLRPGGRRVGRQVSAHHRRRGSAGLGGKRDLLRSRPLADPRDRGPDAARVPGGQARAALRGPLRAAHGAAAQLGRLAGRKAVRVRGWGVGLGRAGSRRRPELGAGARSHCRRSKKDDAVRREREARVLYEILCVRIGAGGMGEVYKAKDTRLERTVAVKVLPQRLSSSPEVRQRFEREAKTISQLSHAHILASTTSGERARRYLVMEFLEGETLLERLAKGPLPPRKTLDYRAPDRATGWTPHTSRGSCTGT